MRFFRDIALARRLYREDSAAHLGDIAVLKADAFGVDVSRPLRPLLDPVRGWVPEIDLERLGRLPPGTFGRALADFMGDNDLSPLRITDAIDDATRRRNAFGIRYAATHDMLHVLLGFDTSWVGELGVLAFAVGQRYSAAQVVGACLAWLSYPLLSGFRVRALWRAWRRGLRLGRRAPFLLGLRLEERFEEPLAALRRELSLAE